MSIAGGSIDATYNTGILIRFGVLQGSFVVQNGQWYRIITSMFIHIGFLHIFFNMYALYFLGSIVETLFGKERFLFIYFFSGVLGNILSLFFYYNSMSAGASGAIFGLSGFLLVYGLYRKDTVLNLRSFATSAILPFIIFNVIFGFIPHSHINNAAHLGGLLGGAIFGFFLSPHERFSYKRESVFIKILWTVVISIIAIVVAISFYQMADYAKVDIGAMILFHNSVQKILSEYMNDPNKAMQDAEFLQPYDNETMALKTMLIDGLKKGDLGPFVQKFDEWRHNILTKYKGLITSQ
jgi:rhomboid protease GluP